MSSPLTDKEILELNELCAAVTDETLTDTQRQRLTQWLAESEDARRYYVRSLGLSASLITYAAETQTEAVHAPQTATKNMRSRPAQWSLTLWWRGLIAAGVTAVAALVIYLIAHPARSSLRPPATPAQETFVASITATRDSAWENTGLVPGDRVRQGTQLRLTQGIAEITFDSGATVTLEAPATFVVNTAWDGTLKRGLIKASVPREALGFRIANATVDVVDLGTEFTMNAAENGTAEVRVLKGEVEASPRAGAPDQDTLLMRENDILRFTKTGITPLDNTDPALAQLNPDLTLARFQPATLHYLVTFATAPVETEATTPRADGAILRRPFINSASDATQTNIYSENKIGRALRFDGDRHAQISIPGLSSRTAHTAAFWVKIPKDTNLADSYAMIAWSTAIPKLNARPVHISWNRTPSEGIIGAIRTDFGGGCAIGATNLRDGRWHHIAVIFEPGDATTPLQVKQYVDGYLESGTIIPGQNRSTGRAATAGAPLLDTLWLGCRLGANGPRKDRFRGEIAEVHITDRGLTPVEIVSLMHDNRLTAPQTAIASR